MLDRGNYVHHACINHTYVHTHTHITENPRTATPEALLQLKDALSKLPSVHYALLKYLMKHLQTVAQHSGM